MPNSILGRAPNGTFLAGNSARFARGNDAAVKTGVHSLAVVRERSIEVRKELTDHLGAHLPHLSPADQPMVDLAVDLLTKLRLVNEYLEQTSGGSLIDRRGLERNASRVYLDLTRHVLTIFRELGIGPRARSAILADLGFANQRRTEMTQEAQERLRAKYVGSSDGTDA
ncbi:MAG: hypothetical protein ACYDB4_17760 [Candidatus Dormibacteraceae bacterium]